MIARFPGRCAVSGAPIRPGDTITFDKRRKTVLVASAAPREPVGVSDTVTFYGSAGARTYYRNRNGRCEDAPCCGCCTI
jgi:hypothetical protein